MPQTLANAYFGAWRLPTDGVLVAAISDFLPALFHRYFSLLRERPQRGSIDLPGSAVPLAECTMSNARSSREATIARRSSVLPASCHNEILPVQSAKTQRCIRRVREVLSAAA